MNGGESRCPRCGAGFHCGAHDAVPCACASLKLDAPTLAALRERHETCLCMACLRELQRVAELRRPSAGDPE